MRLYNYQLVSDSPVDLASVLIKAGIVLGNFSRSASKSLNAESFTRFESSGNRAIHISQ
jgi:hypothetical protein